jgi:Putative Ig domain
MSSLFGVILLYFGVIEDAAAQGIIYANNPVSYTLGQTITSNTASCNGTLSNVSITPALPDGMTIDPTSGTISGMPTEIFDSTAYTVSAQCSAAPVSGTLTLGIGDALTAYYVDDINGNDSNDGHTPATAWQTVNMVNITPLGPNTSVRFKRGGIWRQQLKMQSGSPAGAIYYDAYGTGPKPTLMGSVNAANPSDWTALGGNLWQSVATFPPMPGYTNGLPYNNANDVGNFLWGGYTNPGIGVEKWTQSDLQHPSDWFFNTTNWTVVVYSVTNPATAFPGAELAIDRDIVEMSNLGESYAFVQNLSLLYGAASGINGNGSGASYLTFRDLDISYIGGGNLGGSGTRYGAGIVFWGNANNNLVDRNFIAQVYDSGITNQAISSGNNISVYNLTYSNNVVWNASTSFEIWVKSTTNAPGSTMHDIYVLNNSASNPNCWRATQNPPNGSGGFALIIGSSPAVAVYNMVFENNAFAHFASDAIVEQSFLMWQGEMTSDYNDWFHYAPIQVGETLPTDFAEPFTQWAANLPAEQHGIEADPLNVNLLAGDLEPGAGSPLFGKGVNLTYSNGVVLDFNRNPRPATGAFTIGAFQYTP